MAVTACRSMVATSLHHQTNGFTGVVESSGPTITKMEMTDAAEGNRSFDIWNSIQKEKETTSAAPPPYVHPLVRRSLTLMSQKSLETCTESLGSETGSDGFSSGDEFECYREETEEEEDEEQMAEIEKEESEIRLRKNQAIVNYHCSIGRRSPERLFPPPLPSISSRNGPCLKMKSFRGNGRLIIEAATVPSRNYLHAERHGGRLLLSFIETSSQLNNTVSTIKQSHNLAKEDSGEEEDEEVEEEEEVEVVDRGAVVEVKVSTQPPPVSGGAAVKLRRSSLVINKFVIGSPLTAAGKLQSPETVAEVSPKRQSLPKTTAAAAVVAASSVSTSTDGFGYNYLNRHNCRWGPLSPAADSKLLFTSKRRSREELLSDMRRCSELRQPLFIFEQPCCIATSS